jgi:hypothetical protein
VRQFAIQSHNRRWLQCVWVFLFEIYFWWSDFRRRSPIARLICVCLVLSPEKFPSLPMYRNGAEPPRVDSAGLVAGRCGQSLRSSRLDHYVLVLLCLCSCLAQVFFITCFC